MADDQKERLKKRVPVISNRMAGKTKGLVREMKKLRIIKEDEFSDDVNPPDKVLEKLADSGNKDILEYLKTEMIKEGLHDIVFEIITGKTTQTRNPTGSIADKSPSSADVASDGFLDGSEHKLKTQGPDQVKDGLQMESTDRRFEDIFQQNRKMMKAIEAMGQKMAEGFADTGEALKQMREEAMKKDETYLESIKKLETEIQDLKLQLENEETSYKTLKKQFDDMVKHYNDLDEKMKKMGIKERALLDKNKLLENQIQEMRQKLINAKKSKHAKGKMYNELVSPRKGNKK